MLAGGRRFSRPFRKGLNRNSHGNGRGGRAGCRESFGPVIAEARTHRAGTKSWGSGKLTGNNPKTGRNVQVGDTPGTAQEVLFNVYVWEELGGDLRWDDEQHRMSRPDRKRCFGFFNTSQQDIAELAGVFVVQP